MEIVDKILSPTQYVNEVTSKDKIVLHHTAGGTGLSSINWWQQTKERVATHFVIERSGVIYQCVPLKNWSYALAVKPSVFSKYGIRNTNDNLDRSSIQIELASWGGLVKKGDSYYNYIGKEVSSANVVTYASPFKGFKYYEAYTKEQIDSLRDLLLYIKKEYPSIPLDYYEDIWNVSKVALSGKSGLYTHVSFRDDKSDCHPDPKLVQMLRNLKNEGIL